MIQLHLPEKSLVKFIWLSAALENFEQLLTAF